MAFQCVTCGASFDVPAQSLAKYPGWKPRFCREHSPKRTGGATRTRRRGAPPKEREERLTLAQVLARHEGGPSSGVFTDGNSVPNPGPGGWGVVWVEDARVRAQRHGHEAHTTNNRMELVALIEAYKLLPADSDATVYTDSRLCVDTILSWAPGWEKRGWKRKGGVILNLELVQELLALHRAHPGCKLEWIAAHAGNRWNEYADSLSTAWMRDEL
jgi:ribonuclease HI